MTSATDNRATELLRKLLEERGVKWRESVNVANCVFTIYESPIFGEIAAMDNGEYLYFHELNGISVTPDQAIAATLGSDNEYEAKMDELLCYLTNGKFSKSRQYSLDFMKACVDEEYEDAYNELNAELGSGKAKDLLLRTFGLAQMMYDCWLEECKAGANVDVSACNAYSYEFDQIAQAMFDMGLDPNDSDYYRSAELGSGTCELDYDRHCSNCGVCVHESAVLVRKKLDGGLWTVVSKPASFCPNCGARIRKAVE